ncbi:hypothetical protein [Cupriavidus gilardii]|uniref:hypothetical protein n=1 Tax=Cupriavidus gilardii TaxID=82541 RepID=UPI0007E358CB|nr:hypothetical protein [Cupriavidus gilardii]
MPFQFLISSSGEAIAAAHANPEPAQHATGNGALAQGAGRIALDTLPECMLRQIVERLRGAAIVALSRTSRRMHGQLDRDFVAPVRLRERLKWIVSNSAFQRALGDIAQLAPADRCSLLNRMPVEQLHPAIQMRADMARFALLHTDAPGPTARAPHGGTHRAPLVDIAQRPVPALLDIALALDADARVPALTGLAARASRNKERWRDLLEGMLAAAHERKGRAGVASLAEPVQLLTAVAEALADPSRYVVRMACRASLWHRVFDEARALPPAARPPIWLALAASAACDFAAALEQDMPAEPRDTCWYRIIGAIGSQMPADQANEALVAMLDRIDGLDEITSRPAPYIALMEAASRLPDALAVLVMNRVVEQAFRMNSVAVYERIWEAVFGASRGLEPALQQQVLVALGQRLPDADGRLQRWFALSDRVAALPRALRREPLLALVDAELSTDVPAGFAVPRLMGLLEELDLDDRPTLLSGLLQVYDDDPRHWSDMVNAAVDLPRRMRRDPFAAIAHKLLVTREPLPDTPPPQRADDTAAAAPGDVSIAAWPVSERQARRQFTELLGMLTWADRGFVLMAMAPYASVHRFTWLIDEGLYLPRSGRHEVRLFTTLAERATRLTEPRDAAQILPALATAIRTLQPDQCASALYWLHDACQKADMIHLFAPVWAHFHASLPVEDEPPAADGNRLKRKARDRPADA